MTACRVDGESTGFQGRFECLDTSSNIDSCGGCAAQGEGQVCSAIANVDNVACVNSKCVVSACAPGFTVNSNSTACVAEAEGAASRKGSQLVNTLKSAEKFWGF